MTMLEGRRRLGRSLAPQGAASSPRHIPGLRIGAESRQRHLPDLRMRLGPYNLSSNLFLSPLAGYTNLPMRLTLRELGGLDWATTDLVNARSLLEENPRALQLIQTNPADRPLA